jgi:hypothetical protein
MNALFQLQPAVPHGLLRIEHRDFPAPSGGCTPFTTAHLSFDDAAGVDIFLPLGARIYIEYKDADK